MTLPCYDCLYHSSVGEGCECSRHTNETLVLIEFHVDFRHPILFSQVDLKRH